MTRQNSASGNRNFRWEECNDDSVDSGRRKGKETVRLQLPASPAEIGEAFASLDRISLDATATTILDVSSNVPVLYRCLYDVDVEDSEQFQKLQKLAERTDVYKRQASHHLRQLKDSGLIVSRRVGKEVYYRAADTEVAQLLHQIIERTVEVTVSYTHLAH